MSENAFNTVQYSVLPATKPVLAFAYNRPFQTLHSDAFPHRQ